MLLVSASFSPLKQGAESLSGRLVTVGRELFASVAQHGLKQELCRASGLIHAAVGELVLLDHVQQVVTCADGQVTFHYRDSGSGKNTLRTVSG